MVERARAMLTVWGMLEGWGSSLLGVIVVSGEAVGEVDKDVGRDTWDIYLGNQLIRLQRLRSPTVRCLEAKDPEKVVGYVFQYRSKAS